MSISHRKAKEKQAQQTLYQSKNHPQNKHPEYQHSTYKKRQTKAFASPRRTARETSDSAGRVSEVRPGISFTGIRKDWRANNVRTYGNCFRKVPLEKGDVSVSWQGDSPLSQAYGLPAPLLGEPMNKTSSTGTLISKIHLYKNWFSFPDLTKPPKMGIIKSNQLFYDAIMQNVHKVLHSAQSG